MPIGDIDALGAVAAVLMGISLAACAGLRAFMPIFAVGVAARFAHLPVQDWFAWIATDEALLTFGIATFLEVLADKVPFLDHVLDMFHTVARPVAGALVATSAFHQVSPSHSIALGIIVGAPIAGGLHFLKASTRVASTSFTGGLGNPILSFIEDAATVVSTILALIAPVLAGITVLLVTITGYRWLRARRRRVVGERAPVS